MRKSHKDGDRQIQVRCPGPKGNKEQKDKRPEQRLSSLPSYLALPSTFCSGGKQRKQKTRTALSKLGQRGGWGEWVQERGHQSSNSLHGLSDGKGILGTPELSSLPLPPQRRVRCYLSLLSALASNPRSPFQGILDPKLLVGFRRWRSCFNFNPRKSPRLPW